MTATIKGDNNHTLQTVKIALFQYSAIHQHLHTQYLPPTYSVNTHNSINKLYKHRCGSMVSEFGPLKIKESVHSVHLEFPCRHCRRLTSGTLLPSTATDWSCLPRFPTKRPSRAVASRGSADYRIHLWFMYDGAAPHFLLAVGEFLNKVFPEQWIGRGGPTAWSAPYPDLIPLHFHLWWHLKSIVYTRGPG